MGWDTVKKPDAPAEAPKNLSDHEQALLRVLREREKTSMDQLLGQVQLSSTAMAFALLNLELKGLVVPLPGKLYRLAV
jgi:DNA processing protein